MGRALTECDGSAFVKYDKPNGTKKAPAFDADIQSCSVERSSCAAVAHRVSVAR